MELECLFFTWMRLFFHRLFFHFVFHRLFFHRGVCFLNWPSPKEVSYCTFVPLGMPRKVVGRLMGRYSEVLRIRKVGP